MKKLSKKSTRLTLSISLSIFVAVLLVFSGIGIYFVVRSDEFKNPKENINPLEFSVDAWDGRTTNEDKFIHNLANRGEKTKTIDSADSFAFFVKQVNKGNSFEGYTIYLNKNIDLNGHAIQSIKNFKGTFDGGYYTIMNGNFIEGAFFESTNGATIKNVGLYNCNFSKAGLVNKAVNTNIENVYVRSGNIQGLTTAGLVGEFVSNNGEHFIKNSFVDVANVTYALFAKASTEASAENKITIDTCYYAGSTYAYAETENVESIKLVNAEIENFAEWDYTQGYNGKSTWCDYAYAENSTKLEFRYPLLSNFVKVFTKGSYVENIVTINNKSVETTSLSDAAKQVSASETAEVNLIVEKIFVEEEANVKAGSTLVINATNNVTIVRGEKNTGTLISATEEGSKLVIGNTKAKSGETNQITLDGNRDYVEANNLASGALVASFSEDVEFASNVVLKNNLNNQTAGGALLIYGENSEETLKVSISIDNCESTSNGGGICVIDQEVEIANGKISNCTSTGNGGGICLMSSAEEPEIVTQIAKAFGYKNLVRPLSSAKPTANAGTQKPAAGATLQNLEIFGNSVSVKGAGVYTTGAVTIKNCDIYNNTVLQYMYISIGTDFPTQYELEGIWQTYGGGVYAGSAIISNSTIKNNEVKNEFYCVDKEDGASANGGGLYILGDLQLTNSYVTGNTCNIVWGGTIDAYYSWNLPAYSYYSGAYVGGKATISSSSIDNNGIYENGGSYGGLWANSATITNSSISRNSTAAGQYGADYGGFYIQTSLVANNSTFNNNYSVTSTGTYESGTVIYLGAEATLTNCSIESNTTGWGAVINAGTLVLNGSTINSNTAYSNDRALSATTLYVNYTKNSSGTYVKNSNPKVTTISNNYGSWCEQHSIIYSNNAFIYFANIYNNGPIDLQYYSYSDNEEGALEFGNLTMSDTTVDNNRSHTGVGAIRINNSATIDNCSFTNNNALEGHEILGSGGAIYSDGTITISNCEFKNNKAGGNGGAIYSTGRLTISNTEFVGNETDGNGGAIATDEFITIEDPGTEFYKNKALGNGGAIYATKGSITGDYFANQAANGGAVYVKEMSYYWQDWEGSGKIHSIQLRDNKATAGNGGGMYIGSASYIGVNSQYHSEASYAYWESSSAITSYITGNTATGNGGGIYVDGNSWFALYNVEFENNRANGDGGAIYTHTIEYFMECAFSGNRAANGGAIYAKNNIIANYAVDIDYTNNGTFDGETLENIIIPTNPINFTKNVASNNGGAIYAQYMNQAHNLVFLENSAVNGGAVYTEKNVKLTTSLFDGNTATTGSGGAVWAANDYACVVGGTFSGNTATNGNGGAVYTKTAYINRVVSSDPSKNNAWDTSGGKIVFSKNKAKIGGAVNSTGAVNIYNVDFVENSSTNNGGAIYAGAGVIHVEGSLLKNTSTGGLGGAIYAASAVTLQSISAMNNKANSSGGAVYTTNSVKLTSSVIAGNTSTNGSGGGIYASSITSGYKYSGGWVIDEATNTTSSIINNTAYGRGGGIYASLAYLNHVVVSNNKSTSDIGGGIYGGNTILMDNSTVSYNTAATTAGGLYGNTINLNKTSILYNTATSGAGGGLNAPTLTVKESNFIGNKAGTNGGAVNVNTMIAENSNFILNSATNGAAANAKSVVISNSNISDNKATTYGAGFNISDTLTLTNCNFKNNSSGNLGGAVKVQNNAYITNSSFINNSGKGGGAIYSAATVYINYIQENEEYVINSAAPKIFMQGNKANETYGGAIYANNIYVYNADFSENSSYETGGAIYGITVKLDNISFVSNSSTNSQGGAINATTKADINNCSFTNNSAKSNGGAINVTTISVESSQFVNNAGAYGGAINATNATIAASVFKDNDSSSSGGAMNINTLLTLDDSQFLNNTSASIGGAFRCGGTAYVTGSTFENNQSTGAGAFYAPTLYVNYVLDGDTYVFNTSAEKTMIINNKATSGNGGGINTSTAYLYNVYISSNSSSAYGGGVSASTITLNKVEIVQNKATKYGGGIYTGVGYIDDSKISNNVAFSYGGGVHFANSETCSEISNSTIQANSIQDTSTGPGGGIYARIIKITDCDVLENIGGGNGGGLYALTTAYVYGSLFSGNKAVNGAGITVNGVLCINYDYDGTTYTKSSEIKRTSIVRNYAVEAGSAGVYAKGVFINEADVSYNEAATYAGGIYVEKAEVVSVIENSTISYNKSLEATEPENYRGGAGIYAAYSLLIDNCYIQGNTSNMRPGGGVYAGRFAPDSENYSDSYTLTIKNSVITDNHVQSKVKNGGGVYSNIPTTITNTRIANNSAYNGGGVYANYTLTIRGLNGKNSSIENNVAYGNGGGVFAGYYTPDDANYDNSKTVTITNSTISNNIAASGLFPPLRTQFESDEEYNAALAEYENTVKIIIENFNTNHGNGGGVYSNLPATITDTVISSNKAYHGGGIYAANTLTVSQTTKDESNPNIHSNKALGNGGGIHVLGDATISKSVINNNKLKYDGDQTTVGKGGAIYAQNRVDVSFSTLKGNTANKAYDSNNWKDPGIAGGIYADFVYLYASTISESHAAMGSSAIKANTVLLNSGTTIEKCSSEGCYDNNYISVAAVIDCTNLYVNYRYDSTTGTFTKQSGNSVYFNNNTGSYASSIGSVIRAEYAYLNYANFNSNEGNVQTTGSWSDCGGALYVSKDAVMDWVFFDDNETKTSGSACYIAGNATMNYCRFTNNESVMLYEPSCGTSSADGAVVVCGDAVINKCTFKDNTAEGYGAAISVYGNNATFVECTFNDNTTTKTVTSGYYEDEYYYSEGKGGAVYVYKNAQFTDCTFSGNSAYEGGAIYTYGNVTINSTEGKTSSITNNTATNGGGVYVKNGTFSIDNLSTVSANTLTGADAKGADFYLTAGKSVTYTGDLTAPAANPSIYVNSLAIGNTVATAKNEANAAFAMQYINLENDFRLGLNGTNIVTVASAYQVKLNPNGGTITYNTTTTDDIVTLYSTGRTTKLYVDEALTTEVTSLTISIADSERKTYTFLGWTCDGGNTIFTDILSINAAETTYEALFTDKYKNHVFNIGAENGSVNVSKVVATESCEIYQNGSEIIIGNTKITATGNTGYLFEKWVINTDYTTETTTVTAQFAKAISINVTATNANGNVYGVIVMDNNQETGRYNSTFGLISKDTIKLKLYSFLASNPTTNYYQIFQYSVNGVVNSTLYNSYTNDYVEIPLTDLTLGSEDISIEFIYNDAYFMEVTYTNNELMNGLESRSFSVENGLAIKQGTGYVISDNATITFVVDTTAKAENVYFAGLTYTINGVKTVQGEAANQFGADGVDISKVIAHKSHDDNTNKYTYTTSAKISNLTIMAFVAKTHTLTTTIEESVLFTKYQITSLTLVSADGAITQITSSSQNIKLYPSKWEIQNVGSATLDDLDTFFDKDDYTTYVTQEGNTFYLTVT